MLTGDLIRVAVKGSTLAPRYVDPTKPSTAELGDYLVKLFAAHRGKPRGELQEAIDDFVAPRRDHRLARGLAKLLSDRSTFDDRPAVPCKELRDAVFRRAAELGPLAMEAGLLQRPTADTVLAEVGERYGLSIDQTREALYADLREAHKLLETKVPSAQWLLDRYNVALVQALVLRATKLTVTLEGPTAPRTRQFFRFVRFRQLVHRCTRKGKKLTVELDGPMSMFTASTRYGLQLAQFVPAALLQPSVKLEAEVLWTKAKHRKSLRIDASHGLVSHLADTGAYKTTIATHFEGRFAEHKSPWKLSDETDPIELGGGKILVPDYLLTHRKKRVHLQIVGFWRKDWLEAHLKATASRDDLVVAVSRKLRGCKSKLTEWPSHVLEFAEVLSPKKVIAAAEALS